MQIAKTDYTLKLWAVPSAAQLGECRTSVTLLTKTPVDHTSNFFWKNYRTQLILTQRYYRFLLVVQTEKTMEADTFKEEICFWTVFTRGHILFYLAHIMNSSSFSHMIKYKFNMATDSWVKLTQVSLFFLLYSYLENVIYMILWPRTWIQAISPYMLGKKLQKQWSSIAGICLSFSIPLPFQFSVSSN